MKPESRRPVIAGAMAFVFAALVMWPHIGALGVIGGLLAAFVVYLVILFASVDFHDGPTIF